VQPTLEAEIRENLWRPKRSRIYRPIPTGFGAPAAVTVVARMSTGIGQTIGQLLSLRAGAPLGRSPASERTLHQRWLTASHDQVRTSPPPSAASLEPCTCTLHAHTHC
jgi:hypothetical protein